MPTTATESIERLAAQEYQHGFVTDIEQEIIPPGLDEDVIRLISAKKNEPEWLLAWRLKAFRTWQAMDEPTWPNVTYEPVDYQAISYYAAPKDQKDGPKSLDEVDPELLRTYERLGIPLAEQKMLAGVAVDAVFDSVSVATTFKDKLTEMGVVFCSFSEAAREHPELVRQYLGTVVPASDNFFAALNSAVFSDGSFVFVPKGVRCPMELSTYFRINAMNTGQFERTLIIAEEGAYVTAEPASSSGSRRRRWVSAKGAAATTSSGSTVMRPLKAARARAVRMRVSSPRAPSVPSLRPRAAMSPSTSSDTVTAGRALRAATMRRRCLSPSFLYAAAKASRSVSNASRRLMISTRV
ncbi:MAG: hypothetical protein AAF772_16785, partial [Acidobacteriota bacterium]